MNTARIYCAPHPNHPRRPIQQLRIDAAALHHSIDVLSCMMGMPVDQQREAAEEIVRQVEALQVDCNRLYYSLVEGKP